MISSGTMKVTSTATNSASRPRKRKRAKPKPASELTKRPGDRDGQPDEQAVGHVAAESVLAEDEGEAGQRRLARDEGPDGERAHVAEDLGVLPEGRAQRPQERQYAGQGDSQQDQIQEPESQGGAPAHQ
jgi:hypothetical protein